MTVEGDGIPKQGRLLGVDHGRHACFLASDQVRQAPAASQLLEDHGDILAAKWACRKVPSPLAVQEALIALASDTQPDVAQSPVGDCPLPGVK